MYGFFLDVRHFFIRLDANYRIQNIKYLNPYDAIFENKK